MIGLKPDMLFYFINPVWSWVRSCVALDLRFSLRLINFGVVLSILTVIMAEIETSVKPFNNIKSKGECSDKTFSYNL